MLLKCQNSHRRVSPGHGNSWILVRLFSRPRKSSQLNGGLSRLHSADEDAVLVADQLWFMTRIREEEEDGKSRKMTVTS